MNAIGHLSKNNKNSHAGYCNIISEYDRSIVLATETSLLFN